jgi:protein tyrosine/serine phosphatase
LTPPPGDRLNRGPQPSVALACATREGQIRRMTEAADPTSAGLQTRRAQLAAWLEFALKDHALLRLGFRNAHWVSDELVRTNHPWPHQLAGWKARGVRTVVNLRGPSDGAAQRIEREACAALGLRLIDFRVSSKEAPRREQVLAAQRLFDEIAYPALMHCKSGADRTGLMSVLYLNFRKGRPIGEAIEQLGLRYLHMKSGRPGVLDAVFARYLAEAEPRGVGFLDWVRSPAYDPAAIETAYARRMKRSWLADGLLRRE